MAQKTKNLKWLWVTLASAMGLTILAYLILPIILYSAGVAYYGALAQKECKGKIECYYRDLMDGMVYENKEYHFNVLTGDIWKYQAYKSTDKTDFSPFVKNEVKRIGFKEKDSAQRDNFVVKIIRNSNNLGLNEATQEYQTNLKNQSGITEVKNTTGSEPIWERKQSIEFQYKNKTFFDVIIVNKNYIIVTEAISKDGDKTLLNKSSISDDFYLIADKVYFSGD